MRDVGAKRLWLITVLVASLIVTLGGRLYYVQIVDRHPATLAGTQLSSGKIVIPAARGLVVDDQGKPLIDNTSTHVVTVNWETLQEQKDKGKAVLARLAALLGTNATDLGRKITPCGAKVPDPCWTGEPYQPVPVASNAGTGVVLAISEHREDFPGVAVTTQTVRNYPGGSLAAQLLGYAGAVGAKDEQADSKLVDSDTIGRSGLEEQYDSILRGVDGTQQVQLDARGFAVGTGKITAAQQGATLVTSIDSGVQAQAEKALADEIAAVRKNGKPATSGAVVVMDPNTGRIIAAASYPTYNPQIFVGGISVADYQKLTAPGSGDPLVGRAIDGQYAPGSTFKLITASSLVSHNEITTSGRYPCPGSLTIDGRVKTNYDSEAFGYPLSLAQALQVSCDTFFYAPAANEYYADQKLVDANQKANEFLQQTASAYGLGSSPGVDLPADEQAGGSYADRETRMSRWQANKATYCADAASGFPNEKDPAQRAYLTELAKENCTDGWRYRAGDNADMAIGQGETTLSPLQLAVAYSAMLNGGKIWNPTIGWAVVNAAGQVVKTINPTVKNTVPVAQSTLSYIANALHFQNNHAVSGANAFDGAPYKTLLGGKTGTAEVQGQQDTSWLASWGPVGTDASGNPTAKYVVVGMIEQAGTGASAAAPMLRQVYNGLLGAGQPALLPGSSPVTALPHIGPSVAPTSIGTTSPSTTVTSASSHQPASPSHKPGAQAPAIATAPVRAGRQR
ncbi:MAG: penicillin-binding protein 2 [Actinobacteria bacterium]|nr:penicillin-binding protein 2 [Actinomycetota bacterium]